MSSEEEFRMDGLAEGFSQTSIGHHSSSSEDDTEAKPVRMTGSSVTEGVDLTTIQVARNSGEFMENARASAAKAFAKRLELANAEKVQTRADSARRKAVQEKSAASPPKAAKQDKSVRTSRSQSRKREPSATGRRQAGAPASGPSSPAAGSKPTLGKIPPVVPKTETQAHLGGQDKPQPMRIYFDGDVEEYVNSLVTRVAGGVSRDGVDPEGATQSMLACAAGDVNTNPLMGIAYERAVVDDYDEEGQLDKAVLAVQGAKPGGSKGTTSPEERKKKNLFSSAARLAVVMRNSPNCGTRIEGFLRGGALSPRFCSAVCTHLQRLKVGATVLNRTLKDRERAAKAAALIDVWAARGIYTGDSVQKDS